MKPLIEPARARGRGRPRAGTGPNWDAFLAALREWPFVWYALQQAACTSQAAYQRREAHPEFGQEWEAAIQEGASRLAFVFARDSFEGWVPRENDPRAADRERPDPRAQIHVLRALLPEQWSPAIRVTQQHDRAALRAMTDEEFAAVLRARYGDEGGM